MLLLEKYYGEQNKTRKEDRNCWRCERETAREGQNEMTPLLKPEGSHETT